MPKDEEIKGEAPIKPYSKKELCVLYGVDPKTLNRWLANYEEGIGKKIGRYYNVVQVKIIFDKLGHPGGYFEK